MSVRTLFLTAVAALWLPLSVLAGTGLTDITAAAQRGDAEAQHELGILYEFGYGMANNQIAALAWYNLAAQQGHAKAAARRDILKARLPQADIAKAAARRDILKARLPQADIDKAAGTSARLLAKQPAGAKAGDSPETAPPAPQN